MFIFENYSLCLVVCHHLLTHGDTVDPTLLFLFHMLLQTHAECRYAECRQGHFQKLFIDFKERGIDYEQTMQPVPGQAKAQGVSLS